MLKLYDWQCQRCGAVQEKTVRVPDGEDADRKLLTTCECAPSGGLVLHVRLMSAPAKYLGDRPLAPRVFGGSNDTAGYRPVPQYPELRDGISYEDREMPDGKVQRTKVIKAAALAEHQSTPQWREVHAAREAICDENAAKQARLPALKAGKVDLRHSKLPGDPKLTEKRKATHGRRGNRAGTAAPR